MRGQGGGRGDSQQSDHMKRKSRIQAVADPRTSSVIVTAAKDLMDQVANIVATLDSVDAHQQKVVAFAIRYADPTEVQTLMQDLFQSPNARPSSSSTTQSALDERETQLEQENTTSTGTLQGGAGGAGAGPR